jgi:hypothetical protein
MIAVRWGSWHSSSLAVGARRCQNTDLIDVQHTADAGQHMIARWGNALGTAGGDAVSPSLMRGDCLKSNTPANMSQ